MTFDIDNWKGSLLKCVSKQEKDIKKEKTVFYYVTGEIKKSDTDVMGMNNVTIQTVEGSPFFNISAYDLWMLDSSDFVIISPFIKIGHVPVFWAPFYYHSDNNLYFNPVYGIKNREGITFQNTIYFMGKKTVKKGENDFSFLSFDNGQASTNLELNGLTLVPSKDKEKYNGDYSKLMVDYYSNLGLFIGNKTSLNFDSIKSKIEIEGGLGFSRNIDEVTGVVYNNDKSEWNSSYILNEKYPFRYLLYLKLTSPIIKLDLKSMSDGNFRNDFFKRTEDFKWLDYFTSQLDDGIESFTNSSSKEVYTRDLSLEPIISQYNISLNINNFSPQTNIIKPFLDSFQLDFQDFKVDFYSKTDTNIDKKYDPSYKFFYPERLTIPVALSFSGRIFDTSYNFKENVNSTKKEIYKFDNPLFDVENPMQEKASGSEDKKNEENPLEIKAPEILKNETVNQKKVSLVNSKLSYNIKLPYTLNGKWKNSDWKTLSDINYELTDEDLQYNFDPNSLLNFDFNLYDSLLTISDSLKGNIYGKSYIKNNDQLNIIDLYRWNKTLLENNLSIKLSLLKILPEIKNQTLIVSYDLNNPLYKKSFDEDAYKLTDKSEPVYKTEENLWTKDFVNKNEMNINYTMNESPFNTKVTYNRKLPPLDEEDNIKFQEIIKFDIQDLIENISESTLGYLKKNSENELSEIVSASQKYSISLFNWKSEIELGFKQSDKFIDVEKNKDDFEFDPVKLSSSYKIDKILDLSLQVNYNIEDDRWDYYQGKAKVYDFSISLNSIFQKPLKWDVSNNRWITLDSEEEVLVPNILTLEHDLNIKKMYLWKNRITLDIKTNLSIKKEFVRIDKSSLRYSLVFELDIFEFLNLKFSSTSSNNSLFQYFTPEREKLGLNYDKNIFEDLIRSFNFFNTKDREESNFNLYSINIDAIYKMPDWNLVFNYSGKPKIVEEEYKWYQVFSFFVEWKPLSLVRSNIENKDENWSVTTSSKKQ